jgi:5-methylcytosine-specific restriction endonuclease McrA
MQIISRSEAIALGVNVYFTGKPCKWGHIALRRVAGSRCRECHRIESSVARKSDDSREYMRLAQRRYRYKHPDRVKAYEKQNKDKSAARSRKWRSRNPEKSKAAFLRYHYKNKSKRLEQNLEWRLANPEKCKESHRAWKIENIDRWRELQRIGAENRRARKIKAEGRITRSDVLALFDSQKGLCAARDCCVKLDKGFHVDHIIPLSRNGTNQPDNTQLLCAPCNQSKNSKTMREWETHKGNLAAKRCGIVTREVQLVEQGNKHQDSRT